MTSITHFKTTKSWWVYFLIILSIPGWLFGQENSLPDKFVFGKVAATSGSGRIASASTFRMSGKPTSLRMVRGVGGVSFDQVAVPDENLTIDTVSLIYNPSAEDGNRLKVSLDADKNKYYTANIPDWQLIPIAKYADSEYTALVSLYGESIDSDKSQIVYHEAVLNTLLGLRLFHADLLLADNSGTLWELPRREKMGEVPSISEVVKGTDEEKFLPDSSQIDKYNFAFGQIQDIMEYQIVQSYILTDDDAEVKFSVSDSLLLISGEPYYLFNSLKEDKIDYFRYMYDCVQSMFKFPKGVILRI